MWSLGKVIGLGPEMTKVSVWLYYSRESNIQVLLSLASAEKGSPARSLGKLGLYSRPSISDEMGNYVTFSEVPCFSNTAAAM